MKILALHGIGSSASMLEAQLRMIMKEMGSSWEISFLNGSVPCKRGPGMPAWSSGPFYSYVDGYTPDEARRSLEHLDNFILEEGPFDGVLGFSQGAAVALTYLLDYQERCPEARPPFGFALLFSPVVAISPNTAYCRTLVQGLLEDHLDEFTKVFNFLPAADLSSVLSPSEMVFTEYLSRTILSLERVGLGDVIDRTFLSATGSDGDNVPRPLHPRLFDGCLRIPSVHVTGKNDLPGFSDWSQCALELCCETMVKMYRHNSGHGIPSSRAEAKAIAKLIEWAYEKSKDDDVMYQLSQI